jgi:hypothetical protein
MLNYIVYKDIFMTPKRKQVEEYIYTHLTNIDPTETNTLRYKKLFTSMSDEQFNDFMIKLKDKKIQLYLLAPNNKLQLHLNNLFEAGHKLNIDFFERLWLVDPATKKKYLTTYKYMVVKLPIRRLKQYLVHKMSLPNSDKKVDYLTGQVINEDKAANISFIEAQELYAYNFKHSLVELFKTRGGDQHAYQDLKNKIYESGNASLNDVAPGSLVKSTLVMSQVLKAAMISNNYFGNTEG